MGQPLQLNEKSAGAQDKRLFVSCKRDAPRQIRFLELSNAWFNYEQVNAQSLALQIKNFRLFAVYSGPRNPDNSLSYTLLEN
jgi:hypothetical protein